MNRRHFIKGLAALPLTYPAILSAASSLKTSFRLAFGSCAFSDKPQPIWRAVQASQPDVFAFLGDTIYADTYDMKVMRAKYVQMDRDPDFAAFRRHVPLIATWDDHDFGGNDFGGEYTKKAESKALFLEFFREPQDSIRRRRDGVYSSFIFGQAPHRVQVILLDMRWFRTPLKLDNAPTTYLPDDSPQSSFLGAEQWAWFEKQLRQPAEVRLIGSSIQFAGSQFRFEKWANFPLEKQRLLKMIDSLQVKNVIVLSGDVHSGELSAEHTPNGQEILDFTSSGLNRFEAANWRPNSKRLNLFDKGSNFGVVSVDWLRREVRLEMRDVDGAVKFKHTRPITEPATG